MVKSLIEASRKYDAEATAPAGTPWMWTLAFGRHEDPTPTHGYEATRESAMEAFAKSRRAANLQPRVTLPHA